MYYISLHTLYSFILDLSCHCNNSASSITMGDCCHDNSGDKARQVDIPLHIKEDISISDMDRESTDIEVRTHAYMW